MGRSARAGEDRRAAQRVLVRSRRPRGLGVTIALLCAGALFAAAVTAAVVRFMPEPDPLWALAIAGIGAVAVILFVLPVHWLPALIILILAFAPTRLIPSDGPFAAVPPLAIILGIWVFRRAVLGQVPAASALREVGPGQEPPSSASRFAVTGVALTLCLWLGLSALVLNPADETTIGWSTAFIASVMLPLLVGDASAEARLLANVWLVSSVFITIYLVAETVLGFSPIYGAVREFEFSVYRPHAAFSHPLFAAAFLTIPAAYGIGRWLVTGQRWTLFCGVAAAAGVVATVSRGSIAAIAVAAAVGLVLSPFIVGWAHIARWARFLVVCLLGGVAVLNFGPLVERSDSMESQLSAGARELGALVTLQASEYSGWIGTGPGTSGVTGRLFNDVIIENSLFQLLISIGIPGLGLFILLMGALAWAAWARSDLGTVLAIIGYIIAIASFNSLDAVRSMHILIGFLVLLALNVNQPGMVREQRGGAVPADAFLRATDTSRVAQTPLIGSP